MKQLLQTLLVGTCAVALSGCFGGDDDDDRGDTPVVVAPPPVVPPPPTPVGVVDPVVQADFGSVFDRAFAQDRDALPIDVQPGDITATEPNGIPVDVEPG